MQRYACGTNIVTKRGSSPGTTAKRYSGQDSGANQLLLDVGVGAEAISSTWPFSLIIQPVASTI